MKARLALVALIIGMLNGCGSTSSDLQRATSTAQAAQVTSLQATTTALVSQVRSNTTVPVGAAAQEARATPTVSPTILPTPAPTAAPTPTPTVVPAATIVPTATPAPKPGDVLYQADWSSGLNGWAGGSWKAVGGILLYDGTFTASAWNAAPYDLGAVANYAVEAEIQYVTGANCFGLVARGGFDASNRGTSIGYLGGHYVGTNELFISYGKCIYHDTSLISTHPAKLDREWHLYRLEVKGNTIALKVDGSEVVKVVDNTQLLPGKAGIADAGSQISVRNFKVIAL